MRPLDVRWRTNALGSVFKGAEAASYHRELDGRKELHGEFFHTGGDAAGLLEPAHTQSMRQLDIIPKLQSSSVCSLERMRFHIPFRRQRENRVYKLFQEP